MLKMLPQVRKAARVSHKVTLVETENGGKKRKMIRVCKKCQAEID